MKKRKPYWEMTTRELTEATKQFDDPNYDPPAVTPTAKQLAQLKRWKRKAVARRSNLILSLDQDLIRRADEYAASHGIPLSQLVSDALLRLMRKKSA